MWRRCVYCPNSRQNRHIEAELGMDELDLIAAGSKAACGEIQTYIEETAGLPVPSLCN